MNKLNFFYFIILIFHFSAQTSNPECIKRELSSEHNLTQATFTPITSKTNIKSLQEIYSHLKTIANNKLIQNIEAKRLINQEDWKKSLKKNPDAPWKAYGDDTINAWIKGREYILSLPNNTKIDSQLLKNIHYIVTEKHKFHGFEGRRIVKNFSDGKISADQRKISLENAYKKNQEVSGVPHSSLRGLFRHDPIDQIIHRGSSFKKDGSRYFTKNELEKLRKNKYVTIDEKSIQKIDENSYTGVARYEDVSKIESTVKNVLNNVERKLKTVTKPIEVVRTVVSMTRDLISIHPFLDGNGRTVRLLGDYILSRYNLPPSLYPNESELILSINEASQFHLNGMKAYLKEYQEHVIAHLKSNL